jgi:hypothetical protein
MNHSTGEKRDTRDTCDGDCQVDLRQLGPRITCMLLSILLGFALVAVITYVLPTRDHFPLPAGSCGFSHIRQGHFVEGGDPVLMGVGGVLMSLTLYALMRRRFLELPMQPIRHDGSYGQRLLPRAVARVSVARTLRRS